MTSPLVSVIMPSYNHGAYIEQAIESILDQSMGDLELVIVDDGSKDNSPEKIESYTDHDGRVKSIFHDENKGIAETVNHALSKAKGEYIAHTASDDLWARDKLAHQLNVLDSAAGSLVWTQGELIDSNGDLIGDTFSQYHNSENSSKSGCLFHELIQGNYIFGTSILYNSAIRNDLQFDTSLQYLNDYKFMLDLSARTRFEYVHEPLTYYRIHKKNTISSEDWNDTTMRERLAIREHVRKEYEGLLDKKHFRNVYLQDAADQFRLNQYQDGIESYVKAVEADPYSVENVLYAGYLPASFIPGAQQKLSKVWSGLRSMFDGPRVRK